MKEDGQKLPFPDIGSETLMSWLILSILPTANSRSAIVASPVFRSAFVYSSREKDTKAPRNLTNLSNMSRRVRNRFISTFKWEKLNN